MSIARAAVVSLALVCAGCAGGSRYTSGWDGRRGYDGNGDYGYDVAASRSEAGSYRARASRSYPAPGTPDDPWGPYIREAAGRFQVPERWIRAVMRQESGGRQYESDGSLMVSWAGAMGLMQVMPRTYDMLRQRYRLGGDPYDPHDNIMAGTAYIREMYDRFGSPAFLAAYNAGPDRLDSYLTRGNSLPDETVNYLASVAPRLGPDVPASGPLAVYAGGTAGAGAVALQPAASDADRAFAGGGMSGMDYAAAQQVAAGTDDPSARAFDGGGLVTADAPTGVLTAPAQPVGAATPSGAAGAPVGDRSVRMAALASPAPAPVPAAARPPPAAAFPALIPAAAAATRPGEWGIQVGAYPDPANSRSAIATARARGGDLLSGAQPAVVVVQRSGTLYRARLVGLSAENARAACARLAGQGMDCFTVPPGS
jgi:hypothetical protein